jgi:uncharacterized MAPEG superfamily protein
MTIMPPESKTLVGGIGLGFLHILLASHSASLQRGYRWTAGARDAPVAALTGVPGRLERASRNFAETFPLFAAAVLLVRLQGVSNHLTAYGAYAYLAARIIYLGLYAAGVVFWRSMVWNVATLSILAMLLGLRWS